jgi:hypothetical protein
MKTQNQTMFSEFNGVTIMKTIVKGYSYYDTFRKGEKNLFFPKLGVAGVEYSL